MSYGNKCKVCETNIPDDTVLCEFCKNLASTPNTKKKEHKSKMKDNRTTVILKCCKCLKATKFNTIQPEVFKEYVEGKEWICISCKNPTGRSENWKI